MGTDRKYGKVTTEHGDIPEHEPVIVFRGRDSQVPAMLARYIDLCEKAGSPPRHLELVRESRSQIMTWQVDNPDKVRVPDSERSREWMGR